MNLHEKENHYILAKQKYYEGEPIISDYEFDLLEEELRESNSQVIHLVGSSLLKDAKFNHASPMLSLGKIQVPSNSEIPSDKVLQWFNSIAPTKQTNLEATPKFDGSSCNLIYDKGKLQYALTRGNGIQGQNIVEKMKLFVPKTINILDKIEIRGEVVIPTKAFNEHYSSEYKNPRNFVSGILGRDEINEEILSHFHFVSFEARIHTDSGFYHHPHTFPFLTENGFIIPPFTKHFDVNNFKSLYDEMYNHRITDSPYQLDGFVLKFEESLRNEIGESDHSPKWAIAIKFPPKEAKTRIKDIVWSPGLSGEFTPLGILEPVDLDGTTVSNVNMHNYGNVIRQGLFPGAEVIIVKSGDIIPIIHKIVKPANGTIEQYLPKSCSSPMCNIVVENNIHLVCTNENCESRILNQLGRGIGSYAFRNIGGSTMRKLYKAGIKSIIDVFDNTKFNEQKLIESGEFKKGRSLEIILQSRNNPESKITLPLIISSLAFANVGMSTAKQIAKYINGEEVNWSGLSHASYSPFLNKESKEYKSVIALRNMIESNGFKIYFDEIKIISKDSILFEMTGSPKEYGFKTKEEFVKKVAEQGYVHTSLSDKCKFLITDDLYSTSSKMAKAKKLGVEIITYTDLLKRLENI
jgi:DNA ligase (NAD+)